ncbi:Cytosol aminopeptidase PepA [hydrothermal vent metagenome]|uniref:leucyl aminopeptidase n=1 Tax=hydrothermal vent metagenome TaxID=652676 RepID=A0A1W1CEF8_9ZZZZ
MIDFSYTAKPLNEIQNITIVIGLFKGEEHPINQYNLSLELEAIHILYDVKGFKAKQVVVLGLGDKDKFDGKKYQKVLLSLITFIKKNELTSIVMPVFNVVDQNDSWAILTAARSFENNQYQIKKIHKEESQKKLLQVVFNTNISDINLLEHGKFIANGMALTRELADMPSNICTPTYLAEVAKKMAKEYSLNCEILSEEQMLKLGMNALLSVSKGSIEEAKLITLEYNNNDDAQPIVLVGKGVTFDSGGISLKPGSAMDEMKYDMGGAASVLGVMKAVVQMKLKVNLTIVIPSVENMPAGNASKPGDVVQSMSGQTIEILNTDAEGRLILCDALTYCKKFNPKVVIDVATLTGAVIIALGKENTGLMTNDDNLAQALIQAGKESYDSVWQLPLSEEYDKLLDSNFADMGNIGGREAGSITAGCFLARFTKEYTWAHLDIAGTAWVSGNKKGATGRPVSLLVQYIKNSIES